LIGTALGTVMDGLEPRLVHVEADVSRGLPQFSIVGLPDSAVAESKLRIRSAIRNSGFMVPPQRITVNLSPASVRKRGAGLDLPIAVAILRASGQLPERNGADSAFCGELSLSGNVTGVDGIVNVALCVHRAGVKQLYLPGSQADQGVLLPPLEWIAADSLADVVHALTHPDERKRLSFSENPYVDTYPEEKMSDVLGLENVKRGLVIAAVGGHHTLIMGPPGCGKTMVAQRFPTLLPNLSDGDALACYAIWQAAGLPRKLTHRPPVRMPHHSLTSSGLIGGGSQIHPGEATLAHRGVLILDELLEFSRQTLDALREPLASRQIHLARLGNHVILPANFQLIGTLNPCPCGYHGSASCRCSQREVRQYWSALSGPLLDRVEMILSVPPQRRRSQAAAPAAKTDEELRAAVRQARENLESRPGVKSGIGPILTLDDFDEGARSLLQRVSDNLKMSMRGLKSLERIARSISALESRTAVTASDVEEAYHLKSSPSI